MDENKIEIGIIVEEFADEMLERMLECDNGENEWQNPEKRDMYIAKMYQNIASGQLVDAANYIMMIWNLDQIKEADNGKEN